MLLISVIVPAYNAEKYIEKCLKSVIGQTYRNIEIIVVDDGSKDLTKRIIEQHVKKDPRIKTIFHEKNYGVSKSRNDALIMARGDCVTFIDADDSVSNQYIEELVNALKDAELSICGYIRCEDYNKKEILLGIQGGIDKDIFYYNVLCSNIIHAACWNKMFLLSIIKENNILFEENIYVGEDMLFLMRYASFCNKIYYVNKPLYCYYKNKNSVQQSAYNNKIMDAKIISCLEAVQRLDEYILCQENLDKYISYRKVRTSIWLIFQMIISGNWKKSVLREIKFICKKNKNNFLVLLES